MDSILDFFKSINWATFSSTVVTVALSLWVLFKFFAKSIIEESVKNEFARGLETFKSELAKKNMEHQVNYTLYNTERNNACTELYKKLADAHSHLSKVIICANAYNSLPDFAKSKTDEYDASLNKFEQALSEFSDHLNRHKVFIPNTLYNELDIHFFMLYSLTPELTFLFKPTQLYKDDNEKTEKMKEKLESINKEYSDLHKFWNEHQDIFRELMNPEIKE